MIRPSSLIASLAIAGSVCLSPLEGQSLSEKANLQIEQLRYDGPDVNPLDYNTMSIYVEATVTYGGTDAIINEDSRLIAGCWMNTEAASAEKPGKLWSDWESSNCFNNDWIHSPDFPPGCGEHLIDKSLLSVRRLSCQNGAPAMPRCFQSTQPNRFIGWAAGGAWHLTDGLTFGDVSVRQALPSGELPCKRHFLLHGTVEGLEVGDSLEFHADVPHPETGTLVPWDARMTPSTGSILPKAPQIADAPPTPQRSSGGRTRRPAHSNGTARRPSRRRSPTSTTRAARRAASI